MFTCICIDGDWDTSLVVLQGGAVSLRHKNIKLLECNVCVFIPVENFVFLDSILKVVLCDVKDG